MDKSYFISIVLSILLLSTGLLTGCTPSGGSSAIAEPFVFEDDFTNPNSGWFVYNSDNTKGGEYTQGAYRVWAIDKNTVIALNPKTRQQLADFSVEVDVRQSSDRKPARMGIVYRLDNAGHYYRFAISENQTFYVGEKSDLGIEEVLHDETYSDIIKPGNEYNRLKLVCRGENHEFYINGIKMAAISDNTSVKGELGMAFSNIVPSENFTFTNFKLDHFK